MTQLKSPKRILVVRTDRIGDVILSLPVAAAIRKSYPESSVSYLIQPYVNDVVEGHPDIAHVLLDKKEKGVRALCAMAGRIKCERFDAVLVLHPTFRLAVMMALARVPVRVGTAYRFYSFLFNRRIREHRKVSTRHEAEYNLSLAEAIGADVSEVKFTVPVSQDADNALLKLLNQMQIRIDKPLVIIHPGSLQSALDWPLDHFKDLVTCLSAKNILQVIITGSTGEMTVADSVAASDKSNVWSLAGKLDLKMLTALLARVELCIANSTGPLHIAAALGTEVIGLYPPIRSMRPRRWGPYGKQNSALIPEGFCEKCSKAECERFNCMKEIPVEAVCQLAFKKLKMMG